MALRKDPPSAGYEQIFEEKKDAWKAAVEKLAEDLPNYGTLIPHAWFYKSFGIAPPQRGNWMNIPLQFVFRHNMEKLIDHMLREHRVLLRNVPGRGWELIPPWDQPQRAIRDLRVSLKRTTRKARLRLENVRLEELAPKQQRAHGRALDLLERVQNAIPTTDDLRGL